MVHESEKIDLVAHDPKTDRAILAMVENRPWGEKGELLPELQKKLNVYLGYVLGGQLASDYPALKDKKIRLVLQTSHPLTPREEKFSEIVKRNHLDPRNIEWEVRLLNPEKG